MQSFFTIDAVPIAAVGTVAAVVAGAVVVVALVPGVVSVVVVVVVLTKVVDRPSALAIDAFFIFKFVAGYAVALTPRQERSGAGTDGVFFALR